MALIFYSKHDLAATSPGSASLPGIDAHSGVVSFTATGCACVLENRPLSLPAVNNATHLLNPLNRRF